MSHIYPKYLIKVPHLTWILLQYNDRVKENRFSGESFSVAYSTLSMLWVIQKVFLASNVVDAKHWFKKKYSWCLIWCWESVPGVQNAVEAKHDSRMLLCEVRCGRAKAMILHGSMLWISSEWKPFLCTFLLAGLWDTHLSTFLLTASKSTVF